MRYAADWKLHSSWAALIATSYAIYLQKTLLEQDEDWVFSPSQLKNLMVPKQCHQNAEDTGVVLDFVRVNGECRIQDPLKFQALELNRLGYLDL
ncbi:hypothetical protein HG263_18730 [Pseudoalteromonas sp. JBTF-M23]|uniref:Uncharacterized protein n=1 Tax=Pseudoalteromonas caenipelagi TaxID=2726988 RepID=A0A849VGJ8_9GAMM|nr:hypothetical protein [Pseudoalteromonas caenipelagi]NOU52542.1 hypothetical protein [Pseudoalteromonas caenipelagi]